MEERPRRVTWDKKSHVHTSILPLCILIQSFLAATSSRRGGQRDSHICQQDPASGHCCAASLGPQGFQEWAKASTLLEMPS